MVSLCLPATYAIALLSADFLRKASSPAAWQRGAFEVSSHLQKNGFEYFSTANHVFWEQEIKEDPEAQYI